MADRMQELTKRERDVVRTLCELRRSVDSDLPSVDQIAERLFVGRASVAMLLANVSRKLGLQVTDLGAVTKAIVDRGWCEPEDPVRV